MIIPIINATVLKIEKTTESKTSVESGKEKNHDIFDSEEIRFRDIVVADDALGYKKRSHSLLPGIVTVHTVADEEYQGLFPGRWRRKMITDIGRAGLIFLGLHLIPFLVVSTESWDSNDNTHDARSLFYEARSEVDKGNCDIMIAFTGQHMNDHIVGIAECPGDDVLCGVVKNTYMDNLIQHECSHLFGCPDHIPGKAIWCV